MLYHHIPSYSLAQTKRDFDGVRMHRFVPVKALQRLHAVDFLTLLVIAIAKNGRYHFLALRVFVAIFQRFMTRALEIQYGVVDWN